MRVVKIGGHELSRKDCLSFLSRALLDLNEPVVLIHGGGEKIDHLQHQLGIKSTKVNGIRVTDRTTLTHSLMVLCGSVNKKLTANLVQAGHNAIGICGVDAGLMRCRRLHSSDYDPGFVGEIQEIRVDLLQFWLQSGLLPVISPISLGYDGQILNVNADQAAAAVASAMHAELLDLVSDVPGVYAGKNIVPTLNKVQVDDFIQDGIIHTGMIPKVQAALKALEAGVKRVRIVDLAGFAANAGTTITL